MRLPYNHPQKYLKMSRPRRTGIFGRNDNKRFVRASASCLGVPGHFVIAIRDRQDRRSTRKSSMVEWSFREESAGGNGSAVVHDSYDHRSFSRCTERNRIFHAVVRAQSDNCILRRGCFRNRNPLSVLRSETGERVRRSGGPRSLLLADARCDLLTRTLKSGQNEQNRQNE